MQLLLFNTSTRLAQFSKFVKRFFLMFGQLVSRKQLPVLSVPGRDEIYIRDVPPHLGHFIQSSSSLETTCPQAGDLQMYTFEQPCFVNAICSPHRGHRRLSKKSRNTIPVPPQWPQCLSVVILS